MKYEIIGVGKMGSCMAYTMLLQNEKVHIILTEPVKEFRNKAKAEYYDLLPVARATKNKLEFRTTISKTSDAYILTAGQPRTSPKQSKESLYEYNSELILGFLKKIPNRMPLFVVTNPVYKLTKLLKRHGHIAIPLRKCTDKLRKDKKINNKVLKHKGHTQYTPAYACAHTIQQLIGGPWE